MNRNSGTHCAVVGCTYNRRKLNELLQRPCYEHFPSLRSACECGKPFTFHRIPADPDLTRQWLAALRLKNPPQHIFVCSFHFVDKKPTKENPIPQLFLGYEKKVTSRRILVRTAVSAPNTSGHVVAREETRKRKSSTIVSTVVPEKRQIMTDSFTDEMTYTEEPVPYLPPTNARTRGDMGTQWEDPSLKDHSYHREQEIGISKQTQTQDMEVKSISIQCDILEEEGVAINLIKTDSDAKLYTGVPHQVFLTIIAKCKPFSNLSFKMHLADQVLLTLMKLKLNLLIADLARRFGVSDSLISKIISYWIDFMATLLGELIFWLSREQIRSTMPKCFKLRYPKTTCIIDCTETLMQKANNLKSRAESFSVYKAHNTAKYLVAIAPCGLIMFISDSYGGRASDKFIVEDSGILNMLLPGDEVMADRGFTITDLLFPLQVKLNIPAFTNGGKQLTEEKVTDTRRLANVRIHVERAIRRLKVFNILKDTVPVSMAKKIDKILMICAALVNLGGSLIKDEPEDIN